MEKVIQKDNNITLVIKTFETTQSNKDNMIGFDLYIKTKKTFLGIFNKTIILDSKNIWVKNITDLQIEVDDFYNKFIRNKNMLDEYYNKAKLMIDNL